jgi:regulator of Ty1 transposition protein 109
VSVDSTTVPSNNDKPPSAKDVLSFAIEVFVYTTKHLTTIFVSKIDSTSYISRHRPSPIQRTVTAFLEWLKDSQLQKHPNRKIVISLFARAQAQYIFPGSSDDRGDAKYNKHVLDDRQLIKWWVRTIDPLIPRDSSDKTTYKGHLTVPGYEGNELKRSFTPTTPHWLPGNPLPELARARGLPPTAPPRCLLPRFPDDPKARFIDELDDEAGLSQPSQSSAPSTPSKRKPHWKSVHHLTHFWEAMEYRQECSSGRVVGFLWLVITPPGHIDPEPGHDDAEDRSLIPVGDRVVEMRTDAIPAFRQREAQHHFKQQQRMKKPIKPLTGPIIPTLRPPRAKGSPLPSISLSSTNKNKQFYITIDTTDLLSRGILVSKEGYEKALSTLLNLDFANLEIAIKSTRKWIGEVGSICGLGRGEDFGVDVIGTAVEGSKVFGSAGGGVGAGVGQQYTFADDSVNGGEGGAGDGAGGEKVNDLSGMVVRRKKRSATTTTAAAAAAEEGEGDMPELNGGGVEAAPPVNVLGGGMVRKKAKTNV